jgi:hypothetical protein
MAVLRPSHVRGARRGLVAAVTVVAAVAVACVAPSPATAPAPAAASAGEHRSIVFPVVGTASLTDTFGAPRSGGRTHAGQDIFAPKMAHLVAVVDGRVTSKTWSNAGLAGNALTITDDEGWRYVYIHLNNDTPGTDDGVNRHDQAFAPGIVVGQRVKAGQLLGYNGDSGNAEATSPHLHFEIRTPDNVAVNPYRSLVSAPRFRLTDAAVAGLQPHGNLDGAGRNPTTGGVEIWGWAVDRVVDKAVRVTVYVGGAPVVSALTATSRPDVRAVYPNTTTKHGYTFTGLTAGPGAQVCVVAAAVDGGGVRTLGCFTAP